MSDENREKKPKTSIDFSHIGGKKVRHPVPVQTAQPIDFSSIGGKCVRKASDHPMFNARPEQTATSTNHDVRQKETAPS